MLLQTVRPNIVQSIRAYRVEDLMQAARDTGQHFLYANMANAQSKQEVLDGIAEAFTFPTHFGKNVGTSRANASGTRSSAPSSCSTACSRSSPRSATTPSAWR